MIEVDGRRTIHVLNLPIVSIVAGALTMVPAAANPLQPPTVEYVAEVDMARDTTGLELPVRHFYAGRKVRLDMIGNMFLYDLDRQQMILVMPQIRKYDGPIAFSEAIADGRRWVGVEATTAEAIGRDALLGRPVTKYKVRGFILDGHSPFEGEVWSTAENIVLRALGTAQFSAGPRPVRLTTTKLTVGPLDTRLLTVPVGYRKTGN